MKFGVFDHVDRGASSLAELYESRLKLAEIYDRSGFYAYHIAEHHATPLGMASAPGVFLAAVAQRTKRLRFGPLVYILSLSHPLRILEEICMLDQMSNGRLEVGVGRGVSPYEVGYFGVDPQSSSKIYTEAYQIILQGLQSREINFEGEVFQLKNVPVAMECVQKPHPPIWYGLSHPNAVPWAAQNNINIVCNGRAGAGARHHRSLPAGMAAGVRIERRQIADDGARPPYRGRRDQQGGVRDRASARSASGTTA